MAKKLRNGSGFWKSSVDLIRLPHTFWDMRNRHVRVKIYHWEKGVSQRLSYVRAFWSPFRVPIEFSQISRRKTLFLTPRTCSRNSQYLTFKISFPKSCNNFLFRTFHKVIAEHIFSYIVFVEILYRLSFKIFLRYFFSNFFFELLRVPLDLLRV